MAVMGAGGMGRKGRTKIRKASNGGRMSIMSKPSMTRHARRRGDDEGGDEMALLGPGRVKISGNPGAAKVTLRS